MTYYIRGGDLSPHIHNGSRAFAFLLSSKCPSPLLGILLQQRRIKAVLELIQIFLVISEPLGLLPAEGSDLQVAGHR